MTTIIVILHVFVCLFLIAVILLQAGRGQGLSWGTFGGTPQSILGTKTAKFFSRLTAGCAIVFLLTCIGLNVIETRKSRSLLAPKRAISESDLSRIQEALEKAKAEVQQEPEEPETHTEPPETAEPAPATAVG